MKKLVITFLALMGLVCKAEINILPTPEFAVESEGLFILSKSTAVIHCDQAKDSATWLVKKLNKPTGYKLKLQNKQNTKNISNAIILDYVDSESLGAEGYILAVEQNGVMILANNEAGFFYGCQSLLQLLPAEICDEQKSDTKWEIACLTIKDRPRFPWRSFMLDSGRQYQKPEFIKKYLDQMATLKMNKFHWHLTEGQGWRIEIKKYPKLTSIGSKVAQGKEQQGFYTQEQIKDIVAYAKKLHIDVVPEIDVPGHSEAALIAYPEYSCMGKAPKSVMGFTSVLFCGGNEKTYQFMEDIFTEVCELFPSEYIHIGGDEAPKADWKKCPQCQKKIKEQGLKNEHELQIYFTNRLARFLHQKGRKVICWGDVVTMPGPAMEKNVVVHWWNYRGHKDKALKEAIRRNQEIICNTNYYSYLNFPLTPWNQYRQNRTFDLKTCYEKNPSYLKPEYTDKHENIIGMGTCLWTDWFVQEYMIDRRVFPRIYAMAEQMWHKGKLTSFDDFYKKLKTHYPRLKAAKIDYGPAMIDEMSKGYKWD
ncbi:MAG: beta-N-acetylhexosaminidase [Phycisphaerae bacterium]|nr:beta-N-acetylhexosaminidase [Phycisphaerae bacterium]